MKLGSRCRCRGLVAAELLLSLRLILLKLLHEVNEKCHHALNRIRCCKPGGCSSRVRNWKAVNCRYHVGFDDISSIVESSDLPRGQLRLQGIESVN